MESGIIEQPRTKKHANGNCIDRISELPDSVLHHILSFLETKYTVQTCILSKRWTHLWASVPALYFIDESFDRIDNFESFVDTVLLLRDASDLRSFILRLYVYFDDGHLNKWIRHATKYNLKVLQIYLPEYCRRFPIDILPCQSLEKLSMNFHFIVQHGPPKIMGCLRRLHIHSVNYKHGFMENLISSCPVLEDLDLYDCEFDALCISSNTLKKLRIRYCRFGLSENLISAPSLVCLTYSNNSGTTTLKNLSTLLNATVHITRCDAFEITRGLANVETLNFSCSEYYQCELPEDLSQFPIFDYLRNLTMDGKCTSNMIQVVALFLQHSPNLRTFTLKSRGVSLLRVRQWQAIQKSQNLSFRCPHLQLIEIQCSQREEKLLELIKYLLLNAIRVPKIVINWT